jgi:hypothetical protein
MQTHKKVSSLFQNAPTQWGFRGDPHLWNEMQARLEDCAYPSTEEAFMILLEETYHQLTGAPLSKSEPIFVERYNHGGMSSGYISPQFWTEKAFPLLRSRYRDSK